MRYLSPKLKVYDNTMERFYATVSKINAIVTKICDIALIFMPEGWF